MGGSGGQGLVSSAVRSVLVNDCPVDDRPVDDRGLLGERHRQAALGYRTHGRDAATFQIVLPGIRMWPERPPRNVVSAGFSAAGFSGVTLARRGRRRRGRRG